MVYPFQGTVSNRTLRTGLTRGSSVMVVYVCALVGFEAHVVVVQAGPQEFVCAILDKVLAKASNALEGFQTVDLHLYLAKIDGEWIHSDEDAAIEMRSGAIPRSVRDLVGSSTEIDQAGTIESRIGGVPQSGGVIHLLIVPTKGRIEQDQDYDDGVNQIAARLKDHPYVVQLDKTIESLRLHTGVHPTPFIVLENSSGTGKTQMAFNLQAHGVHEVYYIPCADAIDGALDPPDGGHSLSHTMYQAYASRAECFLSCVQKDIALLADGSVQNIISTDVLHTYGFIVAALRGKGNVGNFAVTRADVVEALKQRCKPCVFFLDEFPRVGSPIGSALTDQEREKSVKRVRIMRNTFRSFGIPVVISSTNGSARNLSQLGSRSRDAVQTDGVLWCFIFPRLPPASIEDEINALYLPEILQQILRDSRPLFTHMALEYIRTHDFRNTNIVSYLDELVCDLALTIKRLKTRTAEFELSQLCLFLATSYKIIDEHGNHIDSHFAGLVEREIFELSLGELGVLSNGRVWQCSCTFPVPENDMLLHLTLTGGKRFYPFEQPLHQLVTAPYIQNLVNYNNILQRSNPGMRLEALASAAIAVASHRGGFCGISFTQFMGALLYDLGLGSAFQLPLDLVNAGLDRLVVPFLSTPNTRWPRWFIEGLGGTTAKFANLMRTRNEDRIDFRVSSNEISGECKDYSSSLSLAVLKAILMRIPDESRVHLVVTNKLQGAYFTRENASDMGNEERRKLALFIELEKCQLPLKTESTRDDIALPPILNYFRSWIPRA